MIQEICLFVWKEAKACTFAVCFFMLLFLSRQFSFGIPRYDFLFLSMIFVQVIFVIIKVESWDELKVIFLFHLAGLGLELFKTHPTIGAWSYPEPAFFKLFTVPLYSGFMYSAVASYIIQAWRLFNLELKFHPSIVLTLPLAATIYVHFFLRHFAIDLRMMLILVVFLIYSRTVVFFQIEKKVRKMPLWLAFLLISFFIWVAENISTFLGAWSYPHQLTTWQLVHSTKFSAWFLLFIFSFIIVTDLKILRKKL